MITFGWLFAVVDDGGGGGSGSGGDGDASTGCISNAKQNS